MIRSRRTPWDEKSLGLKTAELFIEETSDSGLLKKAIKNEEQALRDEGVQLIYTRVNGSKIDLKAVLHECEFYFAETTLVLSRKGLNNYKPIKALKVDLEDLLPVDIDKIKHIAENSFYFGRFHEDPFVSTQKARLRFSNWIDDLVDQNVDFKVAKKGQLIIGFNCQKKLTESVVDLTLSGCKVGCELYVTALWNEIMLYNQSKGIHRITTKISACNLGVLNLYTTLGFKVTETLFGFHKFLDTKLTN